MHIFAVFNLKPGVSEDDYLAWARSTDLPTVNALPSIASFRVFRATRVLGSDAKPPFGWIEVLDIADMEQFGKDVATAAMGEVAAAFNNMVEVTFVTTEEVLA
ncbi:REDY-like protein HapK [Novosphingobium jiangmenense]|uniref:REDY-like protein HapK n=1 Tax=Novosphingobium jiangmenense TaxID=2791981 RepID=A0ABS0HBW2_9SPHN|nr:REDY-like protein HapK [Novosphingobium jiangmenense]MBF9149451.1 REDY-like protein HapK [Novosphingobium jiangmenense]